MKKLVFLALLLFPALALAQIPSGYVQAQATVPILANGYFGAAWTNLSSSPQLGLLGCVSTFQTTVNGTIDSYGKFSVLLADPGQICPSPSTWTFTFTCFTPPGAFITPITVTGGGSIDDISAQIIAAAPTNICQGGSGGRQLTVETNGAPNLSQTLLNFVDTATIKAVNPNGGIEQLNCTTATNSLLGCSRPDNTTIAINSGVLSSLISPVDFQHNDVNLTGAFVANPQILDFNDTTPAAPGGNQNCTWQADPVTGRISCYVPDTAIPVLQMQPIPPDTNQGVFIPFTACSTNTSGGYNSSLTSLYVCGIGTSANSGAMVSIPGSLFNHNTTMELTFSLPSSLASYGINPANVTAVIPMAWTALNSFGTGACAGTGISGTSPFSNPSGYQATTAALSGPVGTNFGSIICNYNFVQSVFGTFINFATAQIGLWVEYTGTPATPPAALNIAYPLQYTRWSDTLGVAPFWPQGDWSLTVAQINAIYPPGSNVNFDANVSDLSATSGTCVGGGSIPGRCRSNGSVYLVDSATNYGLSNSTAGLCFQGFWTSVNCSFGGSSLLQPAIVQQGNTGTSGTSTFTMTNAGDGVVVVYGSGNGTTPTITGGTFSPIFNVGSNAYVGYVATNIPSGSVTITAGVTTGSYGQWYEVSNLNNSSPINGTPVTANPTTSPTTPTESIGPMTTTAINTLLFASSYGCIPSSISYGYSGLTTDGNFAGASGTAAGIGQNYGSIYNFTCGGTASTQLALFALQGATNGGGGGGSVTWPANNTVVVSNTTNSPIGVPGNVTGQVATGQNGAPFSFISPGLPTSVVTTTSTLTLCDTSTALTGRGSNFLLQPSGAITITIPDPATSGCSGYIAFKVSNESSQTVTVNRGTSATFTVINGTTSTGSLTTFNLTAGQSAVLSSDNTNWHVTIPGGGGSSGLSGMTSGQVPIAATATTVTSSKALAGTGSGITTGPTTSTNLDCANFTGTGGQIADSGAPCGTGSGGYTNVVASSTSDTTVAAINAKCTGGQTYVASVPITFTAGGMINSGCTVSHWAGGIWSGSVSITFDGNVTQLGDPTLFFSGPTITFSSSNYGSPSVQAHAPVEWWGAKGDGSTNNSTAIQACLTAGPIQCQLQVGTYNFVGPLTISASAVGIAGANGTGSANTSILQNTSASTDSIRVWGTGTGSQLVGNRFNDFLVWRSVTPTGTPAGLSFKFTASNVVERVNSNDSYQLFYLNNFANGLIEDSHGYWNHGTSTLASYYCYYVDGANAPQSTTLINDTCVDPNVSNTVTAFEATGADISDIFLTLFQASGTEYGEVWDGSTGGSGGFHATDDHSTDAILDHISTSAYKVVDYSAVNSNLLEIKGGWCNAPGTNTTPLIDVESSSGVVFSNVQCTSTTVAATIPETVYVNGSSNIGFVNNILTQATGATSSSVMLLNNSNTISITGNQIYAGSSRITAGIAGTSLTASTIAGNAINGNSGATTGITFDASSTGNSALTNAFGTLLHTVVDSAGTNQWCDGTVPCHNVASGGGTTTNALTMNNGGSGAASGTTFNGSAAQTISYNTIGAAPLASPTFTGTPAAPTATGGTSTTQLATTAFVQAAIATAGTGGGIVTYSGPSLTFSGTLYFPIGGGGLSSTTESNVDIDSPAATTVQNMTIQMSAAPGVGNSITYTWRKNGSSTALTCTISGSSATSCSDTTHSFTTVALDLLDIQAVTTGTVVGTPTVVMAAQMGVAASGGTGAMTNITNSITWSGCTVSSGVCATTGSVSTISASSIPGTYNHLIFEMSGIGSTAIALTCQLNSDTSAHYANQGPTTNAGSISSTNTVSQTAFGCGDVGTLASHSRIEMPFYSGANPKSIIVNTSLWSSVSSSTNNFTNLINSLWTGTAAITAVSFTTSSGTISSGYQIAVYGVN